MRGRRGGGGEGRNETLRQKKEARQEHQERNLNHDARAAVLILGFRYFTKKKTCTSKNYKNRFF